MSLYNCENQDKVKENIAERSIEPSRDVFLTAGFCVSATGCSGCVSDAISDSSDRQIS